MSDGDGDDEDDDDVGTDTTKEEWNKASTYHHLGTTHSSLLWDVSASSRPYKSLLSDTALWYRMDPHCQT